MEHAQRALNSCPFGGLPLIVLILILMEHAQRERLYVLSNFAVNVLILILMEHAQRVGSKVVDKTSKVVLILILMEHAQRVSHR